MIIQPMPRFGDQVWGYPVYPFSRIDCAWGVSKKSACFLSLSFSSSLSCFLKKPDYCRKSTIPWQLKLHCVLYCVGKVNRIRTHEDTMHEKCRQVTSIHVLIDARLAFVTMERIIWNGEKFKLHMINLLNDIRIIYFALYTLDMKEIKLLGRY